MHRIVESRCVLAVRNLKESTAFYTDALGFRRDSIRIRGLELPIRGRFQADAG